MKEYPSTTYFPNNPKKLSREELESSYLEIRDNYKGLQISRGQYASKAKNLQSELLALDEAQSKLLQRLSIKDNQEKEFQEIIGELQKVSQKQKQVIADVREEFEFVRDNKGSIIDKFNRIMRAVYKLLNQDVSDAFKKQNNAELEEDNFADQSPRGIGKSERF